MNALDNFKLDTRPLYVRVEETLVALLEDCSPGDQLPPESELAQQLGVSRATLREALRALEERGMISRRQGVGTFVTSPHPFIKSGLEVLESLDTMACRLGLRCETQDLCIEEQPAKARVATKLQIPTDTLMTIVKRVRVAQGKALAYMYDVVPASLVSAEEMQVNFQGSVLDYLLEKGIPLSYAWTNLLPVRATEQLASALHVPVETILLLLEETLHTQDNHVVNYSRNYFVAGNFQFHVIRRIPV